MGLPIPWVTDGTTIHTNIMETHAWRDDNAIQLNEIRRAKWDLIRGDIV